MPGVNQNLAAQATDFALLVMNDRGASSILSSKVKLGADASYEPLVDEVDHSAGLLAGGVETEVHQRDQTVERNKQASVFIRLEREQRTSSSSWPLSAMKCMGLSCR
jgi:hypothetical protein